jgi:uncharacterized delta-60 repeat protein
MNAIETIESRVLLTAGQLDPFFGTGGIVTTTLPGGASEIYHVEPMPDGRLLAVGGYDSPAGDKLIFARYLRDGQPDTTFGDSSVAPGVVVTDIADPGGGKVKVIDKGKFLFLSESHLIRFNSEDGTVDPTFTQDEHTRYKFGFKAVDLDVQDDGFILIGGRYRPTPAKGGHFGVARLKPDGTRDRSFGIGGVADYFFPTEGTVTSVRAMPDGSIMAAGANHYGYPDDITEYGRDDGVAMKLNTDGTPDASYGTSGVANVVFRDFAGAPIYSHVGPDGSAWLCKYDYADDSSVGIVRITPQGLRDTSYGDDGRTGGGQATNLLLAIENGGMLVAGYGGHTGDNPEPGVDTLRRFTPAGALDTSFGTDGIASVGLDAENVRFRTVTFSLDGTILVALDAGRGIQLARFWNEEAPAVQVNVKNRRSGGAESHRFNVTVRDDGRIDVNSLAASNVRIVGPGGQVIRHKLMSIDARDRSGSVAGMNLKFGAPGGNWGAEDNGAYEIYLEPDQISDTELNRSPGRLIGIFWVHI